MKKIRYLLILGFCILVCWFSIPVILFNIPSQVYYYLPSGNRGSESTAAIFTSTYFLRHEYGISNVSIESLHDDINELFEINPKFDCVVDYKNSRSLEVEKNETLYIETLRFTYGCEGFQDPYYLTITDLTVELLNDQWYVTGWNEIEETIPQK